MVAIANIFYSSRRQRLVRSCISPAFLINFAAMSSVQLFVYDVLANRGCPKEFSSCIRSSSRSSGSGDIAHLSVVVYEEEIEYGDNGVNISQEPVRMKHLILMITQNSNKYSSSYTRVKVKIWKKKSHWVKPEERFKKFGISSRIWRKPHSRNLRTMKVLTAAFTLHTNYASFYWMDRDCHMNI